jgi:hypothetical protein
MGVRRKALVACMVQFPVYTVVGAAMMFMLFHAAVLALPVIAFMWTFFGFSAFALVTGVGVQVRYKLPFALLNLCAVAVALTFLINGSQKSPLLHKVGVVGAAAVGILYVFLAVLFVRKYWPPVNGEILRWLGKTS